MSIRQGDWVYDKNSCDIFIITITTEIGACLGYSPKHEIDRPLNSENCIKSTVLTALMQGGKE